MLRWSVVLCEAERWLSKAIVMSLGAGQTYHGSVDTRLTQCCITVSSVPSCSPHVFSRRLTEQWRLSLVQRAAQIHSLLRSRQYAFPYMFRLSNN